jgi:hypothetical protein
MSDEHLHHDVAALRAELAALRATLERPRRRMNWLAVGVALVLCSTLAFGQLVTFNVDQPALASEVNGNFNQLKVWLEQKVGPVGTNSITTSAVVVGAAAPSQVTLGVNSSGQVTLSGGLALPEGVGITTNRLAAVSSIVNANTTTFGAGFLEGTFADPGGTVVIMASATAFCTSSGRITMVVKVDGVTQGSMRFFCQVLNTHVAFPATFLRLNRTGLTPFGPGVVRTLRLEPLDCTSGCTAGLVATRVDANDFGGDGGAAADAVTLVKFTLRAGPNVTTQRRAIHCSPLPPAHVT